MTHQKFSDKIPAEEFPGGELCFGYSYTSGAYSIGCQGTVLQDLCVYITSPVKSLPVAQVQPMLDYACKYYADSGYVYNYSQVGELTKTTIATNFAFIKYRDAIIKAIVEAIRERCKAYYTLVIMSAPINLSSEARKSATPGGAMAVPGITTADIANYLIEHTKDVIAESPIAVNKAHDYDKSLVQTWVWFPGSHVIPHTGEIHHMSMRNTGGLRRLLKDKLLTGESLLAPWWRKDRFKKALAFYTRWATRHQNAKLRK